MASKREKEVLQTAAEWGDGHASAILHDIAEEESNLAAKKSVDGLEDPYQPQRGSWIVIFTGAFFHVGQYLGEDHEWFFLASHSGQILETDKFTRFYGEGRVKRLEIIPVQANIRKGPVTHITPWPFARIPTATND